MPSTSGSTRTCPTTSACWARRRLHFRSNGPAPRSPATRYAPVCRISTACRPSSVFSSVAARFFEPQISGIGATPAGQGGNGVFRIDHDEIFNSTVHMQYQPSPRAPWLSFNWRYDSGLVAGPVPCAGGNCPNGPNGTDSIVDVNPLTPGSAVPGRAFLRQRACDAHHRNQPQRPLRRIAVRLESGEDPEARHRG